MTGTAITRFEAATTAPTLNQVIDLLDLYEVYGEERHRLITLARDSRKKDWWQPHRDAIPSTFEFFFGLETEASEVRGYEMGFVPGLLQTAEYYRAYLLTPPVGFPLDDIEKMVEFRLERQMRRLTGRLLHLILDEAVLHRHIGGPAVMRAQLAHILDVIAANDNITLQVLPFAAGAHQALDGSFQIMSFPEQIFGDVVYRETPTEARYWEADDVVTRHNIVFRHLQQQALSPEESKAFLAETERSLT